MYKFPETHVPESVESLLPFESLLVDNVVQNQLAESMVMQIISFCLAANIEDDKFLDICSHRAFVGIIYEPFA